MSSECQPPQTKRLAVDDEDEEEDDSPVVFLDHAQSQGIIFNNVLVENVILTLSLKFLGGKLYSMLEILRHFAIKADQTYDSMIMLLSLLKEHQPLPDYTNLPSTGKGLLPLNTIGELPSPKLVYDKSKRVVINKYVHFGLELALIGNSPRIYFKHADLIQ